MRARRSAAMAALLLCSVGCVNDRNRFYCGTPLPGNDSVIRSCTEPNERCVCKFNSCAARQTQPSPDCPSGYEYREFPFAASNLQHHCVSEMELQTALPVGSRALCGDLTDLSAVTTPIDMESVGSEQ